MRLPFGIEIKRNSKTGKNSSVRQYLQKILFPWQYGNHYLQTSHDYSTLLAAYRSWVYICTQRNATAVASSVLRLYVAKPSKSVKMRFATKKVDERQLEYLNTLPSVKSSPKIRQAAQIEEIIEHPFLDLMQHPNSHFSQYDIWELTDTWQELAGNAYWLLGYNKLGLPSEIWPIMPDRVRVIPDPIKFIKAWEYRNGVDPVIIPAKDVIHFRFPNPKSLYYGWSPLEAVSATYNLNESMNIWENSVFSNSGMLQGAFETDESLSEEEFLRLKDEIRTSWTGAHKAGTTPLLENGVHFKSYGLPPREMGFLEGRKWTREEILNAYGLSVAMFDESATRSNADAAAYAHARHAIRPRVQRLEQTLNRDLLPRYDSTLFCAHDSVVPEDQEALLKERIGYVASGIMSLNEVRKDMRMPPFPGGDQPLLQVQYVPLDQIIDGTARTKPGPNVPALSEQQAKKLIDEVVSATLKSFHDNGASDQELDILAANIATGE